MAKKNPRKSGDVRRQVTDQEWSLLYHYVRYGDLLKATQIAYPKIATRTRAQINHIGRRTLARPAVKAELERMREDLRSTERITLEQHLQHLADLRDKAATGGQYAAAVRAEELRGKALGFYWEQHLIREEGPKTTVQVLDKLKALLEVNPELQKLLPQALQGMLAAPEQADHQPVKQIASRSSPSPAGPSESRSPEEDL